MKNLRPHFLVLPPSASRAQKPPNLPRELVSTVSENTELDSQRKGGRPTRMHKAQRIQNAVQKLDNWLDRGGGIYKTPTETEPRLEHTLGSEYSSTTLMEYRTRKAEMMSELRDVDTEAVDRIGKRVLDRLKTIGTIEKQATGSAQVSLDGIRRLERTLASGQSMLELTEAERVEREEKV